MRNVASSLSSMQEKILQLSALWGACGALRMEQCFLFGKTARIGLNPRVKGLSDKGSGDRVGLSSNPFLNESNNFFLLDHR